MSYMKTENNIKKQVRDCMYEAYSVYRDSLYYFTENAKSNFV